MSFAKISTFLLLAAIGSFALVSEATAQSCSKPRQYYSEWKKHPSQDYHYRTYYYKPKDDYPGYKHHYVVYSPKKPKHLYYYNPYQKKYWGRCHAGYTHTQPGHGLYSHLQPQHRQGSIDAIPEAAFPEFGDLPPIPESSDGALLDLPPDDLPIVVTNDSF